MGSLLAVFAGGCQPRPVHPDALKSDATLLKEQRIALGSERAGAWLDEIGSSTTRSLFIEHDEGEEGKACEEQRTFIVTTKNVSADELAEMADVMCRNGRATRFGYSLARHALELDAKQTVAASALAYCAAMRAEMAKKKPECVKRLTERGMEAAQVAGAGAPNEPRAAYLYTLNLGLALQHMGIGALFKIGDLEKHIKIALTDPSVDEGGPLRVAGLFYLKAPAWPQGPGDYDLALETLERAVREFAEHPLNHVFVAEAYLDDGRVDDAQRALETARAKLTSRDFGEYNERWRRAIKRLDKKIAARSKQ